MLKENLTFERKRAVVIIADFSAPVIEGYAMAWLKLCNNAREYKHIIWKIENDRNNNVCVWCNPDRKDEVVNFLTGIVNCYKDQEVVQIGKVIDISEEVIGVPVYEYESTSKGGSDEWEDDIDSAISNWMSIQEVFD
ncbi:hypothetical protein [Blautia intestinalis]|uniref:hypothetical protein n=1 Tax=Blautia intestinalis TaxID=2763028 RepID=UPI0022E76878|nr:hypothetical protein [Blautia intestinalis]